MITKHQLKPCPVTAVRVTGDPQETAANRAEVEKLTDGRAVPGSQRADSFIVETPTGSAMAHPGDWIVRYPDGTLASLSDEAFGRAYEEGTEVEDSNSHPEEVSTNG